MIMKIALQDMKPCSLVDVYQRCRGTCCIRYPDNEVPSWNFHGGTVYIRKTEPSYEVSIPKEKTTTVIPKYKLQSHINV